MSGQKYTFDEGGVAFYYFLATAIALYVIPKTISAIWNTLAPAAKALTRTCAKLECFCDLCALKEKRKQKTDTQTSFNFRLAFGWLALLLLVGVAIRNTKEETKIFDPFEILSISASSTDVQVRKAFKKLSLKYHPDKARPEDKKSHEKKFLEITRAYRALTDETARRNWEEYGNPDGPKSFGLGIALPSWLVDSKYNLLVVLVYVFLFGVGLPMAVRRTWQRSKEYTRDNILHSSMQHFYKEMKDVMSIRRIIEVICQAEEFNEDRLSKDRIERIVSLIDEASTESYEPSKRISSSPSAATAHALLTAHLVRAPLSAEDRDLADKVILKAMRLQNGVYQIAIAKKWPVCAMNCMTLSALLVQALVENSSPLLQLPYLKVDIVKHCQTKKRHVKSIKDVINMDEDERSFLFRDYSEEQIKNLMSVANQMPMILVKSTEFRMLGQDQVTPGGVVTCLVRLELSTFGKFKASSESSAASTDKKTEDAVEGPMAFEFDEDGNMTEGGKVRFATRDEVMTRLAPVHSPYFPVDKRPGWWVILMTRNMSHMISSPIRVTDLIDKKTVSFQFAAPPRPGKYAFTLIVKSDCLLGVDIQRNIDLSIVPSTSNQESDGTKTPTSSNDSESEATGPEGE